MKKAYLITLLTLLFAGTLHAAMQSGDFPYTQELELQSGSNTIVRFGSFVINEALFNELNPQATNLRVMDHDGIETPFLMRTKKGERTVTQERAVPFEKLSFKKLPDNQIEIVVQNKDQRNFNKPLQSIVLTSEIKNFEKHINLYSSDDQQEWKLIAERKSIFDYSQYIDIRNNRVTFAPTVARYFKIIISNITEKHESPFTTLTRETRGGQEFSAVESSSFTRADFRINEIHLYERITTIIKDKTLKQPCTLFDLKIASKDKTTLVSFGTFKTPVAGITLRITTPYYHRRFVLETSADAKSWSSAYSGIVSSINTDAASDEQRTIQLPHTFRAAHYRITVQDHDSPPLEITGVELEAEIHEVLFYCDQVNSYRVIYGALEADRPVYDIGEVLSQIKSEATALYLAGPQQPNPDYGAKTGWNTHLSRRTIMTVAVILMIAALGWVIAKTAGSIEKIE